MDPLPETVPEVSSVPSVPAVKYPWLKSVIAAVVVLLVVLLTGTFYLANRASLLSGLNQPSPTEPPAPATLTRGKLLIATDPTFEPMEFRDENENLVGYDIDLGRSLAEKMGLQVDFRVVVWDDIFSALANREFDVIISSVSITPDRQQLYEFSAPYLNAGQVIITKKTNTTITSTNDLSGKKIAVQKDTTNEAEAMKYTDPDMLLSLGDFEAATRALLDGKADAIFADLTVAKGIITTNPTLKIASEPFTSEQYGIVLAKGNSLLHAQVNQALDALRQQGTLVYLKQKWLE